MTKITHKDLKVGQRFLVEVEVVDQRDMAKESMAVFISTRKNKLIEGLFSVTKITAVT